MAKLCLPFTLTEEEYGKEKDIVRDGVDRLVCFLNGPKKYLVFMFAESPMSFFRIMGNTEQYELVTYYLADISLKRSSFTPIEPANITNDDFIREVSKRMF